MGQHVQERERPRRQRRCQGLLHLQGRGGRLAALSSHAVSSAPRERALCRSRATCSPSHGIHMWPHLEKFCTCIGVYSSLSRLLFFFPDLAVCVGAQVLSII